MPDATTILVFWDQVLSPLFQPVGMFIAGFSITLFTLFRIVETIENASANYRR